MVPKLDPPGEPKNIPLTSTIVHKNTKTNDWRCRSSISEKLDPVAMLLFTSNVFFAFLCAPRYKNAHSLPKA